MNRSLCRLRNLVEQCFKKLKNVSRVATRQDKTAESSLGFIGIALWSVPFVNKTKVVRVARASTGNGASSLWSPFCNNYFPMRK